MPKKNSIKLYQKRDALIGEAQTIEIKNYQDLVDAVTVRLKLQSFIKENSARENGKIKDLNELKKKWIAERDEKIGLAEQILDVIDEKIGEDYLKRKDEVTNAESEINQAIMGSDFMPMVVLPQAERTIQTEIGSVNVRPDIQLEITDKMELVRAIAFTESLLGYVEIDLGFIKRDIKKNNWANIPGIRIKQRPVIGGRAK